jgi:hypothetical protein
MTYKNLKNFCLRASENDALDRTLDGALEKYSAVDPYPGIEDRILANLQAKSKHSPQSAWGNWNLLWRAAVGIAAVVAVAATLMLRTNTKHAPKFTLNPVTESSNAKQPRLQIAPAGVNLELASVPALLSHNAKKLLYPKASVEASPRLDQFPSPRPLTNEEHLLLRYVQKFPEDAVTIARVQTESEIEIEKLISNQPPAQDPEPQQDE